MKIITNPYLPLTEYVPDGEPHVFGNRVYIYGSHDASDATVYCPGHYVTWSASIEDLTDWHYEGVIYRRDQDPSNARDKMQLWAPDVTKGPDGKYYLYYCFSFYPEIGVAVSDSPTGPFQYHGHVHYPAHIQEGRTLHEFMPFDPAVLTDDDGKVYLYYGFAPAAEKEMEIPKLTEDELKNLPDEQKEIMKILSNTKFGENGMVVELESDMITMKDAPQVCIPGGHHTTGTGFEGHGFFEASSIRKICGRYYFVYSSHKSHELCYAVSDYPNKEYRYGGTIISNGDIGLNDRTEPVYTLGNNHGGIAKINGTYYIFYHRQTNGTEFSRQGCAEKIVIKEDGSIDQVEITSCGLNEKPLPATGTYPAAIACHLTSCTTMSRIDYGDPTMKKQSKIRQEQNELLVTQIEDGTVIGYKYFWMQNIQKILLELTGSFHGTVICALDEEGKEKIGYIDLTLTSKYWILQTIPIRMIEGKVAIYLLFKGSGILKLKTIGFLKA